MKKILSILMIVIGFGVLASVTVPIGLSFFTGRANEPLILIDPTETASAAMEDTDLTAADTWFVGQPKPTVNSAAKKISYYKLSIPKVGLEGVTVEIDGNDLMKNAIQYPGTAIPGTYGNTVVFGHSTLPHLYKPLDPVSVFNPLVKTKVGDEVVISYDGVTYRYRITETKIVKPTQIDVLEQQYDKHELTLITCTPLGTYLNRFVAHAELVN
jgi:sortase A